MDKAKHPILDEFGEALMEHVRDDALLFLQRVISGKMADSASKDLYSQIRKFDPNDVDLVKRLLTLAVDAGIVRFLEFIDEFEFELLFQGRSGQRDNIRAISDGLAGELHTKDGWIAKYSKFMDRLDHIK